MSKLYNEQTFYFSRQHLYIVIRISLPTAMKKIIGYILLLSFFISPAVFANNEGGIKFIPEETSFRQILEKAKAENKVIFSDA